MPGERIIDHSKDMVKVEVKPSSDSMREQAGMREIAMPQSLLEVQTEPVKPSNVKPVWAAKNPQRPM